MSEKVKVENRPQRAVHLPAIALRGLVVFPNNIVHFEVGHVRNPSPPSRLPCTANSSVFLVAQREMDVEEPTMR